MPRQYIYQLFIFKQETHKLSQNSMLYFISKSLKINGVPLLQTMNFCEFFLKMS